MVLKELYRNFLVQLQGIYSLSEATTIANWVFEKIAAIKRSDILKDPTKPLNLSAIKPLNDALAQLLEHKPVQYVLGEAWFYNFKLLVNENVLIPRPETEELVEWLITNRKSQLTDPAILDIGTGSGCIPIAIKKNLPAAKVTALDINEKALAVARQNAVQHNTQINFVQLDFLDDNNWAALPIFDVIISNPPYIPLAGKATMERNVLAYEPHTALFVADEIPFIFYEQIAAFGKTHLHPMGRIYTETHEDHAAAVQSIFEKDYTHVEIKKDLFGKERMVMAIIGY